MPAASGESQGPDRSAAVEQYRRAASGYDQHMRRFQRWQEQAVQRLRLRPGQTVIDVACGTGVNFPLLEVAVGASGRVIGVDLSPDMLRRARERIDSHGWANVTLIQSAAEDAEFGEIAADAALFSFTHDVLQSPRAVANVVAHTRPGARVACTGAKYAGRWNLPVNLVVRRMARPYMTTFAGLDRPWRGLERYAGEMRHRSHAFGGAYVAWGRMRPNAAREARRELGLAA